MDASPTAAAAARTRLHLLAWGGAGCIIAVLFLFWPYQHWSFDERSSLVAGLARTVLLDAAMGEWIFCLAVPFLVGYLVYRDRAKLAALPYQGSWGKGLAALLLGLFFFWVGYKADTAYPGYAAAQLITAGLILLLGGSRWMRALLFPWMFLAFMWPLIPLEERLAFPLRVQTASIAAPLINALGIPIVREGTNLASAADAVRDLAQGDLFRLEVDAPCSGIRSLFSLLMISALYGWLALRRPAARWVLFLSAIPLAMVGNLVRMVLLALGCVWFGTEVAIGKTVGEHQEISAYHEFSGYAVFAVALAGMFALCSVLEKKRKKKVKAASSEPAPPASTAEPELPVLPRLLTAAALSALSLGIFTFISEQPTISPPGVTMELPSLVNAMPSEELPMTQTERNALFSDVELARRQYLSPDGRGFYATVVLSGENRRALHRPEVCLPGQGWIIGEKSEIPLQLGDGRELRATLLRLFRDQLDPASGKIVRIRAMNLFWYVGQTGTYTPDYYDHVFRSYYDAVFHDINHRWALVSFFTYLSTELQGGVADPMAELTALTQMQGFIGEVAAKIILKE